MAKLIHSVPVDVHLVLKQENNVLLARRFNTGYADGQYALVSGKHEAKESITSSIIREAKEEVGIDLKPEWLKMNCVMHVNLEFSERIAFFFTAFRWGGSITNCEPHKCDDVRFFSLDELPQNLVPYVKEGIFSSLNQNHFVEFPMSYQLS